MAGGLFSYGIEFYKFIFLSGSPDGKMSSPTLPAPWLDFSRSSFLGARFSPFSRLANALSLRSYRAGGRRWCCCFISDCGSQLQFPCSESPVLPIGTRIRSLLSAMTLAGKNAWAEQIRQVQIRDRAISMEEARRKLSADGVEATVPGLRGSCDFASSTPLHDQLDFLPDLAWTPRNPATAAADGARRVFSAVVQTQRA